MLVKACVENTCLRIAPVVVFAMIFLPLSGIQSGTLRFLLFVSGLSMFWFSITAALYVILAVLPFAGMTMLKVNAQYLKGSCIYKHWPSNQYSSIYHALAGLHGHVHFKVVFPHSIIVAASIHGGI